MTTYTEAKSLIDKEASKLAEQYLINVQIVTAILIKGYNMGLEVAKEALGELK